MASRTGMSPAVSLLFLFVLISKASCRETIDENVLSRLATLEKKFSDLESKYELKTVQLERALEEQGRLTKWLTNVVGKSPTDARRFSNSSGQDLTKDKRRASGDVEAVAFTAYVDHNILHMGIDSVIPYNQVVTNIGGGFNTFTHVFTCPTSGIYLFTFVVSELGSRELVAKLVIDGVNVIDAIANPVTDAHDQQGTNTAIVQVNQGQSVWVVNYLRNDVSMRSDENYRFSSFSGVLIIPTA